MPNTAKIERLAPSPWGPIDGVTPVGEAGIYFVSTASHGGYFVPDELLARIPEGEQRYAERWSRSRNWYEEDCAWASVARAFPALFPEDAAEVAAETYRQVIEPGIAELAR